MRLSSLFIKNELEERILKLAHVRKIEMEEQLLELSEFALGLDKGYETYKRITEQV
jgi:hypothetical protein